MKFTTLKMAFILTEGFTDADLSALLDPDTPFHIANNDIENGSIFVIPEWRKPGKGERAMNKQLLKELGEMMSPRFMEIFEELFLQGYHFAYFSECGDPIKKR